MTFCRSVLDFDGRRLQGVRPFALFEVRGDQWSCQQLNCQLTRTKRGVFEQNGRGDALTALKTLLHQAQEIYGDSGAAVGYFGYDFARQLEPRAFGEKSRAAEESIEAMQPEARLTFYETLEITPQIPSEPRTQANQTVTVAEPSTSSEIPGKYLQDVWRIKEYIETGDIYQANLIWPFERPLTSAPYELYNRLRRQHPARFAAYLKWDDFAIVSNSPERFLKLEGRTLTAEPIKGTVKRGQDSATDEALKSALQQSVKDRAENVMIVDLLRNDLGRVCEWGSIKVPALWKIQTLPSLHHLISTVTGTLRPEMHGVDAFRVAFPCGSITGAPKIRAMQVIEELEKQRRGISMGAIGYFLFNGDMDWNVAIRTLTCRHGKATFHAGGGLVADSQPESEWRELQLKAGALLAALRPEEDSPIHKFPAASKTSD